MNELVMLHAVKPAKILHSAADRKLPVIMSYQSDGQWQCARILIVDLASDCFEIKISPQKKNQPVTIAPGQSVGISLKYGYGAGYDRFIFDTSVVAVETSPPRIGCSSLVLAVPEHIEVIPRRTYLRVNVPSSVGTDVYFWLRQNPSDSHQSGIRQEWHGQLVDISTGGVQIVIDAAQGPDLEKGQFLGLRFTPLPNETPLTFNAQIRNVVSTADGKSLSLGLQMVGLEASPEGRLVLSRLVGVVDEYYRMNNG